MRKVFTVLIVLATLAMIVWGVSKPWREQNRWSELVERTSDLPPVRQTIRILGDDWLGYLVFRSPEFQRTLALQGVRVQFRVEPDFARRIQALREGEAEFIVLTLDSYLASGGAAGWPGAVIFTIDESFGGDAVIGSAGLANLDALNDPAVRGAFVGESPSEFLLEAEASHFQLEQLKPRLASMRVDTIEKAYDALAKGRVDFAVLWEPLSSRALAEIPGAHTLIDTRSAQGLIVDLALASRAVLADNPALVTDVTRAYFATLHDFLNDPEKLRQAAARDTGKPADVAAKMLAGIKFATLDDNLTGWLRPGNPQLATNTESIRKILADYGRSVSLPNNDPLGILYGQVVAALGADRTGITNLPTSGYRDTTHYPPLDDEQWTELRTKVRGTLLEEPITFRPGSTVIPEEFQTILRAAVPKLAHYPAYRVVVEAHVTPSEDAVADVALSKERADAVKDFLVWECAVPENRVHTVGAGGSNPPPALASEGARAWERRTRRARIMLVGD